MFKFILVLTALFAACAGPKESPQQGRPRPQPPGMPELPPGSEPGPCGDPPCIGPFPAYPIARLDGLREVAVTVTAEETRQEDGSWRQIDHADELPFSDLLDVLPMLDGSLALMSVDSAGSWADPARGGPITIAADGSFAGREAFTVYGYAGLNGWLALDWQLAGRIDADRIEYEQRFEVGAGRTSETIEPVWRLRLLVTGGKRYRDLGLGRTARQDGAVIARVVVDPGDCGLMPTDGLVPYDVVAQDEAGGRVRLEGTRFPELMVGTDGGVNQTVAIVVSNVWEEGRIFGRFDGTGFVLHARLDRYRVDQTAHGPKRGERLCAYGATLDGRYRYAPYDLKTDQATTLAGERNVRLLKLGSSCRSLDPDELRTALDVRETEDGRLIFILGRIRTIPFIPAAEGSFRFTLNYIPHTEQITFAGTIGPDQLAFSLEFIERDDQGQAICAATYDASGFRRYAPAR